MRVKYPLQRQAHGLDPLVHEVRGVNYNGLGVEDLNFVQRFDPTGSSSGTVNTEISVARVSLV